jgi:dTDP-4-dehydrorhamnose 3,5-epimerase
MPFEFASLSIPDLKLIKPRVFNDDRGFFLEVYKHSDFSRAGIREYFVQDNYSKSGRFQ